MNIIKKKCSALLVLLLLCSYSVQAQSESSLDPKTKAFLVICGYSAVGGALLGTASMAFGQKPRSIAQGASLGLYAGIAFGAYVLYTHGQAAEPVEDPYVSPDNAAVPYRSSSITDKSPYYVSYSWRF
jgi:uncharacterized membrane protein YebE (DUF533 family)